MERRPAPAPGPDPAAPAAPAAVPAAPAAVPGVLRAAPPAAPSSVSLRFARAARTLADAARRAGLVPPSFRSPPRHTMAFRTVRRQGDSVTVAVRVRGRPFVAVLGDLVEGVVVANRLQGLAADRARTDLWAALEAEGALGTTEVAA